MNFSQWFIAQFGKRPSPESLQSLERKMGNAKMAYLAAKSKCRQLDDWERSRTAALYAWQAREKN